MLVQLRRRPQAHLVIMYWHTCLGTPDPVRSSQLSNRRRVRSQRASPTCHQVVRTCVTTPDEKVFVGGCSEALAKHMAGTRVIAACRKGKQVQLPRTHTALHLQLSKRTTRCEGLRIDQKETPHSLSVVGAVTSKTSNLIPYSGTSLRRTRPPAASCIRLSKHITRCEGLLIKHRTL